MASSDKFTQLIEGIKQNVPNSKIIDMRYMNLNSDMVRTLCDALVQNKSVSELLLSGNQLSLECVEIAKEALLKNESVQVLDLRFCELSKESMPVICEMIDKRPRPFDRILVYPGSRQLDRRPDSSANNKEASSADDDSSAVSIKMTKRIESLMKTISRLENENKELSEKVMRLSETKKKTKKMNIDLNNIQINERISGSSGPGATVFKCHIDGWECAVKEMQYEKSTDVEMTAFLQEIELLEKLPRHPNVVRYLFHRKDSKGLQFFMSSYATSLSTIISKKKQEKLDNPEAEYFNQDDILRWCLDICNGLEFLHHHNIIHRDMKPGNILCSYDVYGNVQNLVITDFNTAKETKNKSRAKTTVGTPAYMCPEVLRSGNSVSYTSKADIWGLGMIIYELTTLKQPYEDYDRFDVGMVIQSGQRTSSPSFFEEEYPKIYNLFIECTQDDPQTRPDVRKIRESIQNILWKIE